jgi:hypothetical protein
MKIAIGDKPYMKKRFLIGIISLVMFAIVLFADSGITEASTLQAQEKTIGANVTANSFAVFVLQEIVLPPLEEEGSIFTNPFYIASAFLIAALVFEIIYFKKKKAREKLERELGKPKYTPSADSLELKQKVHPKRYSKEKMSELLKASAASSRNGQIKAAATPNDVIISDEEIQVEIQKQLAEGELQKAEAQPMPREPLRLDWKLHEPPEMEQLPSMVEDDSFFDALVDIEGEESMIRCLAARILAKHRTNSSVGLLTHAAIDDLDGEVKLEAVEGLRKLAHESCFTPLLIAASDENPNVKQAAVKAFTTLSFNLADNYVRLIKSDDQELMKRAAKACIVTGLVHKAFMQIVSYNYEQGYEGFALLSLLARAGETKPLMDAITKHPNVDVRTLCVRIMNEARKPEAKEEMYGLLKQEDLPSAVRTSIIQTVSQET